MVTMKWNTYYESRNVGLGIAANSMQRHCPTAKCMDMYLMFTDKSNTSNFDITQQYMYIDQPNQYYSTYNS